MGQWKQIQRKQERQSEKDCEKVCTVCVCVYCAPFNICPVQTSPSWTADVQPVFPLVVIRC